MNDNNLQVINLIDFGIINSDNENYYEKFLKFLHELPKLHSQDKKIENYQLKRLDLENHISFDILFDMNKDEIVSFCGIYQRPIYRKNVVRVLNRSFTNKIYRNRTISNFYTAKFIYPVQVSRLKIREFLIDKCQFVSREGVLGKYLLKLLKDLFFNDYVIIDHPVQVTPSKNMVDYQWILIQNNGFDISNPIIQN